MFLFKRHQKLAGCLALLQLAIGIQTYAQDSYSYASRPYKTRSYSAGQYDSQDKQTLFSVLKELNRVKGVFFLFSEESMGNVLVKANKDFEEDTEKILSGLLKNTGLKFKKISENTFVILTTKEKERNNAEATYTDFAGQKKELTRSFAADPIRGRIVAADGSPLPGVSITVKGSSRGTTTNANGEFTIEANKGETLVLSYVGYQNQEIAVGDNQNVSITLTAGDSQLSEVVVTALGIRKERKALGYSVTEIKGSELTQAREINVANSLVGKVAGVNVSSIAGGRDHLPTLLSVVSPV